VQNKAFSSGYNADDDSWIEDTLKLIIYLIVPIECISDYDFLTLLFSTTVILELAIIIIMHHIINIVTLHIISFLINSIFII
jgi:hypothetical protein